MANSGEEGRAGVPAASENFRQTGARKLEARPDEPYHPASQFGPGADDSEERSSHLMEPVNANQEETRSAEGQNPPGSFGTEANPQADAFESDPTSATPEQARRPD